MTQTAKQRKPIKKSPANRESRLETRVTPEQKELFVRAASLQGRTLTDFVVTSLYEAATQVISEHQLIRLSAADSEQFARALVKPPKPSARLRKAALRSGH